MPGKRNRTQHMTEKRRHQFLTEDLTMFTKQNHGVTPESLNLLETVEKEREKKQENSKL
jgi:hypothetical protein